jgi:hypothetical protein
MVPHAPRIFHDQNECQLVVLKALYTPGTCRFRVQKVVTVHVGVCFIQSLHCDSFIESTHN